MSTSSHDRPDDLLATLREKVRTPSFALLGCTPLQIDPEAGVFVARFDPSDQLLNAAGLVHGGQLCAMLDLVTSFAAAGQSGFTKSLLTLELKTNFLSRARQAPIVGIGRVRQGGRSIVFMEGELQQPEGTVIATASATAKLMDPGRVAGA